MAYKSYMFYLYIWLCFISNILIEAAKKAPKKRKAKSRVGNDTDPWKGVSWTVWIFILCIVPPLYIFVKNIWTDPMMPSVFANGIELIKEKMLGFLGKSKEDEAKEKARKMN